MVLLCKALFLYILAMDDENIINLSAALVDDVVDDVCYRNFLCLFCVRCISTEIFMLKLKSLKLWYSAYNSHFRL